MGSWNNTCNVSQLSIGYNKPVRALFLQMSHGTIQPQNKILVGKSNDFARERCYSTDFWHPFSVCIKGEYADYGRIGEIKNDLEVLSFNHVLNQQLIPVEKGENPYHDPNSFVGMDWDEMWNVASEGRLRVRNDQNKAVPLVGVLILDDVWRELVGDCKAQVKVLDSMLDRSLTFIKENKDKPIYYFEMMDDETRQTFGYGSCMEMGAIKNQFDFVRDEIHNQTFDRKSPEVKNFINSLAETLAANYRYNSLRKTWHPGTGLGSQSTDYDSAAQFYTALAAIANKLQKERDEY